MHKIRLKLLLITLVPSMMILGILSLYLLQVRSQDLQERFTEKGNAIVRQLAAATLNGIISNRPDVLELLARETMKNNPEIAAIRVTDANGLVLMERGTPVPARDGLETRFSSPIAPAYDIKQIYLYLLQQPVLAGSDGHVDLGTVTLWQDPSGLLRQQEVVTRNTLLLALAGLLVIALLSIIFSQRIARPLEQLTDAARQLRRGHLDTRVPVDQRGEVGELQRAFNEMAQEIAQASEELHARIEQATRELQESMEILEIKNVELDLARKRALKANRVKSEFLASMSHEIRTPMNGILGFTNLLRKTPLNATQLEYLSTIETSAGNLLAIINDILDLSKLEAGKLNLEHRPFSLRRCVDDTISLLAPMAHQKGLELVAFVYDDVPDELIGDRTRIAQIITNLVNNAIKFTPRGEVVLRLMLEVEEADSVELAMNVTDTGVGIPEEELDHIFETFVQGQTTRTQSPGGTGLGLSICKRLAEMMDGSISVTSRPGQGSTFVCRLHLDRESDAAPAEDADPALRGLRVLLLEPHAVSRQAIAGLLNRMDVAVTAPESVPPLSRLPDARSQGEYDILILCVGGTDLEHPEGIHETLQALRRQAPPLPLLLAGTSRQELLDAFTRSGAAHCLSKPVRLATLRNALLELVPGARPAAAEHLSGGAADRPRWLSGKTILVADDNGINRQLMEVLLREWGARVISASDGREALERLEKSRPDLVLLDIHMPRLDGFETANAIRALPGGDTLPLVAMTADAMWKNRQQLNRSGFDTYLIKPIEERELARVLRELQLPPDGRPARERPAAATPPGAPAANGHLPVRDLAQALRITGGSERIAANLFAQFLEALPADLERIASLLEAENWEELWQAVHRLQGAVAVCGVPAFAAALTAFQASIQEEDPVAAGNHLQAVLAEKERLLQEEATPLLQEA
jgi:Signal transduction histidine kinase